jgi:hypothetical protein
VPPLLVPRRWAGAPVDGAAPQALRGITAAHRHPDAHHVRRARTAREVIALMDGARPGS